MWLTIFSFCLAPFLYSCLQNYLFIKGKKIPPGPWGVPFLGYLPFLNFKELHLSLIDIGKKYGDLYSLQIGTRLAIVFNNSKMIKAAFAKPEFSGRPKEFPFDYFGEGNYGIAGSHGNVWLEQRRFVLRHMRELGVGKSRMEDLVMDEVTKVVKFIKIQGKDGKPTDISANLNIAVVAALWTILTGEQVDHDDENFKSTARDTSRALSEFLFWGALGVIFPTLFKFIPKDMILSKAYKDVHKNIHHYSRKTLNEHKRTFNENNMRDFIDIYLHELNQLESRGELKGSTFSEWQLEVVIGDLFYGGVETTPSNLRWGFLFVATYKDVQRKVQQEIDQVVGRERPVVVQDRLSMPYTEAVICEVQRFAAMGPLGIVHCCESDSTFLGYDVPEGTLLIANLYGSHRDARVWEKPNEFYPEHFLSKEGKFIGNPEGFVSFSAGKRNCIGESIARMEMFLFFANFLQSLDLSLPEGVSVPFVPPPDCTNIRGPPQYELIVQARK